MTIIERERFEAIKKKLFETPKEITDRECIELIDMVNSIEIELSVAKELKEKHAVMVRYYENKLDELMQDSKTKKDN